ncbi:hypothetical protein B7494_g1861 [Chlorociboria aeruginascens]|nr:hypothetical protein B7494_g1861 [Chlorociboria aeruginascens]
MVDRRILLTRGRNTPVGLARKRVHVWQAGRQAGNARDSGTRNAVCASMGDDDGWVDVEVDGRVETEEGGDGRQRWRWRWKVEGGGGGAGADDRMKRRARRRAGLWFWFDLMAPQAGHESDLSRAYEIPQLPQPSASPEASQQADPPPLSPVIQKHRPTSLAGGPILLSSWIPSSVQPLSV